MGERLDEKKEMDIIQAKNILTTCRNLGTTHLTILGGEPTLHNNLLQIIQIAAQNHFDSICIDTNGVCIDKLIQIEPALLHEIRISLDGATSDSNDYIRGDGVFRNVIRNVEKLITRGYNVVFTCTIQKRNINDVLKVIDLAESMDVGKVNFHVMSSEGNGKDIEHLAISADEWRDVCNKIEQYESNVKVWYPPAWSIKEEIEKYEMQGFQGCLGYSMDRLSVMPDGKAYICSLLFDYPYNFFYFDKEGNLSINKKWNEMDMFFENITSQQKLLEAGCPAEMLLGEKKMGYVSLCRCWKAQIDYNVTS
ncbi:MAG: radical SAM protein [Eubacterium sp.]|nr:radical SAM protein [Eubacterium sp.]